VVDMGISESTVLEMLVNYYTYEMNAMNKTAIIARKGIVKTFEYVLIVFVCGDVIRANKVVH
jgi:hypothetical protein